MLPSKKIESKFLWPFSHYENAYRSVRMPESSENITRNGPKPLTSVSGRYKHDAVCLWNGLKTHKSVQWLISASLSRSSQFQRNRQFCCYIATVYKTSIIIKISTFPSTIWRRGLVYRWRFQCYFTVKKAKLQKNLNRAALFWFSLLFYRQLRYSFRTAARFLFKSTIKPVRFVIADLACVSQILILAAVL